MAVSDFSSLSSASSAADQPSQQPEEAGAGEAATPTGSVSESARPVAKNTESPANMATPAQTPVGSQHPGAEAAAGGEAKEGSHSGDEAAAQRKRQNVAAPPAVAANTEKVAGVSSRKLSHLQMTKTMHTFAGGRGSLSGVGAPRPLKHQKQQHGEGIGGSGVRGGRGTSAHHPHAQHPRWHGGSSVSGSRGIEILKRKSGAGFGVHRMCLYGSGALWLPAQQLLSGYSTAPDVAGQPSGRDDLRALVQQQQQQGKCPQPQHGLRGFVAGGARRNASNAVAAALVESNVNFEEAEPPVRQRPATRSLRSYYGVEDLRCAFTQTLQLTNPLTGHTQVMATRKPGFAAAIVNIQDFDAYCSLQMPKRYAALRQKDSLQASHMAYLAPLDDVGLPDKLAGATKKRSPYGWATSWTEVPYATWKDSPRWRRGHQQQAYSAGGDSWEKQPTKQPTKQPQMEGENSQQQQDSRQLQNMQRDSHEWQGRHQQQQIQQPQQRQGELQEQRQHTRDTDPPHVQSEAKGMPVPQGPCCQQQQQGPQQQQQQPVTTQQQEPLGRARQEGLRLENHSQGQHVE